MPEVVYRRGEPHSSRSAADESLEELEKRFFQWRGDETKVTESEFIEIRGYQWDECEMIFEMSSCCDDVLFIVVFTERNCRLLYDYVVNDDLAGGTPIIRTGWPTDTKAVT